MQRKIMFFAGFLTTAIAMAAPGHAEELIPGGTETWKFSVGGILARIDAGIGVDGTAGNGSIIDLNGSADRKNAASFVLGAQWRMAPRHRLTGVFFQTSKTRELAIDGPVNIGDDQLVPPTSLNSESKNRFLFATYEYSFVRNKDVELAGMIGAYLNKFSADISGTATVNNPDGTTTFNRTVTYAPSVTVPMPLIGASIDWFATPALTIGGSLSGLKAKIGDVDGGVYVATVSAEYMFTRNFGAGLTFMHSEVDVDVIKPSFTGSVDWTNDNLLLFAILKF